MALFAKTDYQKFYILNTPSQTLDGWSIKSLEECGTTRRRCHTL